MSKCFHRTGCGMYRWRRGKKRIPRNTCESKKRFSEDANVSKATIAGHLVRNIRVYFAALGVILSASGLGVGSCQREQHLAVLDQTQQSVEEAREAAELALKMLDMRPSFGDGVEKLSQLAVASNVELADQLTAMIVDQRAFRVNTSTITSEERLLAELNHILR